MKKAKSRLKSTPQPKIASKYFIPPENKNEERKSKKGKNKTETKLTHKFVHLKYLPTLFLSIPFWLGVGYIFTRKYPQDIKNLLIPNLYLPLISLFGLANFFTFSFVFLSSRRGFFVSLFLTFILFMRLQRVILQPLNWILLLLGFVVIFSLDLILTRWKNNR